MGIVAGNTILNQFVPPICLNRDLADGQILIYNESCSAFTNLPLYPECLCLEEGIESITIISNGKNTFVIPWEVLDVETVWVTINGVVQHKNVAYVITKSSNGSIITFTENVWEGDVIEIIDFKNYQYGVVDSQVVSSDPSVMRYGLSFNVQKKENLLISINGVKQQQDAYELDNSTGVSTVVFSEALFPDEEVQFHHFPDTQDNLVLIEMLGSEVGQTEFEVYWPVPGKDSIYVSIQGVKQYKDSYDLVSTATGSKIIFKEPLMYKENVEVIGLSTDFCNVSGMIQVDGANLGAGAPVFSHTIRTFEDQTLFFRNIVGAENIEVEYDSRDISIKLSQDVNDLLESTDERLTELETKVDTLGTAFTVAKSVGSGTQLVSKGDAEPDGVLEIKTLVGGTGVTLFDDGKHVYITSSDIVGYRGITASATMVPDDSVIGVQDTTATRIVTLPLADEVETGKIFTIKDETGDASVNNIVVAASGDSRIDGAVSQAITENYGNLKVYSNGSHWFIV